MASSSWHASVRKRPRTTRLSLPALAPCNMYVRILTRACVPHAGAGKRGMNSWDTSSPLRPPPPLSSLAGCIWGGAWACMGRYASMDLVHCAVFSEHAHMCEHSGTRTYYSDHPRIAKFTRVPIRQYVELVLKVTGRGVDVCLTFFFLSPDAIGA